VGVTGRPSSQRLLQRNLPGRAVEEIRSADDIGDLLLGIVHRDRQLIGDEGIAAPDHDIATLPQLKPAFPLEAVREHDLLVWNPEAGRGRTCALWTFAAGTGITAAPVQVAPRAAAFKSVAGAAQAFERCAIELLTPTLVLDRTVPRKAERLEHLKHLIRAAGEHAWRVEILDPQEPATAGVTRVRVAAECGDE
jgi:hypothetical protein